MNLDEIQKLLDEGKAAEANVALDKLMKENPESKAIFEEPKMDSVENKSLENKTTEEVANLTKIEEVKDLTEPKYEEVFAKIMLDRDLNASDKQVFEKVNNAAYTHEVKTQGILIPETTVAGIMEMVSEQYPFYGSIRKLNVAGILKFRKHTGITQGDASFVAEGTAVEDEKNTFVEIQLNGFELAKLVRVSFKLDAMSIQEFLPFIQKEIADRIGVTLGTKVFTGTGTGEPKGLITELKAEDSTPQIVKYTEGTVPTYENLTQLMTKVHPTYVSGAKIYANNNTIWLKLANIVDGENRPVFIPDATSGGVGRLFGYTVAMDGGLSDGQILFANGEAGMVQNTNEALSIQSQKDLTSRETIYLGYMITDWAVLDNKAFGLLEMGE